MVKSRIDATIIYPENKKLSDDDRNYDASLYEITLHGIVVVIALGQPNIDYLDKEIIFYPVYKIENDKVVSKIGLYEINDSIQYSIFDDEGDIDLTKVGEILLYSEDIHSKLTHKMSPLMEEEEEDEDEDEDEDKYTTLHKLPSQDAKQSLVERKAYKKTKGEYWIQTFMRNKNYAIIENEGGGDCLFASIRDGLKKSGVTTTVTELREKLAQEATEDIFQGYLTLHQMAQGEAAMIDSDIKKYEKEYNETARRARSTKDRATLVSLTDSASEIKELHTKAKEEKQSTIRLVNEFKFMKGIVTLEMFKDKVRTSEFWGDTWTISTLERVMNIKLLLFGRETYKNKDIANVLLCGQLNDSVLQKAGVFNPDHYIIIEYTGNHYRLVTYKERGTFTFKEIPYDIKIMVVDRCMEKSAGPFYIIPEFKEFMASLKIPFPQEQDYDKEFKEETDDLYDSNTIFQFYHQSSDGPRPGRGVGEKIEAKDLHNFTKLSTITDWRRKLSNLWLDTITMDGHTWSSVEHFYQASKFRENNPEFYLTFALDSNPAGTLAKDPVLAKYTGSKSGKYKGKLVRPSDVKIDATFFGVRDKIIKNRALMAKFSKKEFNDLLIATKDAKLQQFVRASPPVASIELMEVRKFFMK